MALSDIDRDLLERCLARKPRAWEDFVDRYMGLVVHVVNHTARSRSVQLNPDDRDDLCAHVFLEIVKDDFALLRRFRRQSSLATYLTVVSRRVVVHQLMKRQSAEHAAQRGAAQRGSEAAAQQQAEAGEVEQRLTDREEVERLMAQLDQDEAEVVRMYHLESKSYQEIGAQVGISENSVGPILSRARAKMRQAAQQ